MEFQGLSPSQVQQSREKYGKNIVKTKSESVFKLIVKEFANPMIYLLLGAAIISFVLRDYEECVAIVVILFINAFIGFIQEFRSKRLISRISSYISSSVATIRDGNRKVISKEDLVVGDLVMLKLGDIVPADCVIVKSEDVRVDESVLTGESQVIYKTALILLSESKDDSHILYAGSSIAHGSAIVKVTAVGEETRFGIISRLTTGTKKSSEFEKNTADLSKGFSIVGILFLFIVLTLQLFIKPNGLDRIGELALFTITLTVSLIPEALPVITSLSIVQKAAKLGKKGLVIRHFTALEDLGNIDILCTDKTGTLTENKQKVVSSDIENHTMYNKLWKISQESSDDIDTAISEWLVASKYPIDKNLKLNIDDYTDIPFDPNTRLSGRVLKDEILYKGSVEFILNLCNITGGKHDDIISSVIEQSKSGLRAIAFAAKDKITNENMYLGVVFLADEIKPDADDIVRDCEKNNVELKILTGDSLEVATYIALKAGLIKHPSECIEASKLPFNDPEILQAIIKSKKVFARTKPEDKYNIIKALQANHVVGYLGDGINDAPALALAQVGIVVDTASDIAKSTADIILLKHELNVIISGIRDGRTVFENIQKYLKFTLIGNFGNSFTIGLISLLVPFQPVLAIQVLIINLLTDLPMLAISADKVDDEDLKSPKKQNIKQLLLFSITLGLVSTVFDFIFFGLHRDLQPGKIQTMWFLFSVCTELLLIFSVRSRFQIFKSSTPPRLLVGLAIFSFVVTVWLAVSGFALMGITTISLSALFAILVLTLAYFVTSQIVKFLFYKFIDNT